MRCEANPVFNTVNLLGGMGNQLFQYLFGAILERRTGVPTIYDISDFGSYRTHGGFWLDRIFSAEIPKLAGPEGFRRFPVQRRALKRLAYRLPSSALRLLDIRTDRDFRVSQIEPGQAGQYFLGYWQGMDYDIGELASVIAGWRFSDQIASEAVRHCMALGADPERDAAVHVRLGDYLRLPKACHLPLTAGYYRRAIALLRQQRRVRRIYLFSDDIKTAVTLLAGERNIYPVIGPTSAAVEMRMMAMFKDKLISASTFGWWTAALSEWPQHAIYPAPWVKPDHLDNPILTPPALPGWRPVEAYDTSTGNLVQAGH